MSPSSVPFEYASGSYTTLVWAGVGLLLLLGLAVLIEIFRRRANLRNRRATEWHMVEEIVKEKDLSDEAWALLRGVIQRRSPDEPLRAVTIRLHFDTCVEEEMNGLWAQGDLDRYREMGIRLREIRNSLALTYTPAGQRIRSTRELAAQHPIWISPVGDKTPVWLRTTVSAVDEACFYIEPKNPGGAKVPSLSIGDGVRCRMWREDDARYAFTVRLACTESSPFTWAFRHTSELNRTQSRDYYRVHHEKDTVIGILKAPVGEETSEIRALRVATRIPGRIVNLSAGGFAAVVQQPLSKRALLRTVLKIPGEDPFEVDAHVVSIGPLASGWYLLRAAYVDIEDETRDIIARYVMLRQQPVVDLEGNTGAPEG